MRLSVPAISYLENFLSFPVGTTIPMGAYQRDRGLWIAADSGKVIKILGIVDGKATIDSNGDGVSDDGTSLGMTASERQALASLYPVGQTLWRVPVPHFTRPWDKNMGIACSAGCEKPDNAPPWDPEPKCYDEEDGSIIKCQSQVLGESLGVPGTPFSLHYTSDRVGGRADNRMLEIPLTKDSTPNMLKKVLLEVSVAGTKTEMGYSAQSNLKTTFSWDGKDAYGRPLHQGRWPVKVRIGYGYPLAYSSTSRFGYNGNGTPITITENLFTLWQEWNGFFDSWDARDAGFGGWTLNVHHRYDPGSRTLYEGNGEKRDAKSVGDVISAYSAVGARYVAIGPDGSLYVSLESNRVGRIKPDGSWSIVAGGGSYNMDGIPATSAWLPGAMGLAVGSDGSLYIAAGHAIRRVGPDGIISTVAGTGQAGFSGDGGPATSAQLNSPFGIALAPDGTLYIACNEGGRIRRVGTDGIITTMMNAAGNAGDVAVGPDGSVYVAGMINRKVYRIAPNGIISTFAGTGQAGFSGDGSLAVDAKLYQPSGVAVGPDGSVYIADIVNRRIRRVGPDGIITTVAGTGGGGYSGDGGPATDATFSSSDTFDLAVGPDGSLYIADFGSKVVRRVGSALPGVSLVDSAIPSTDGNELYLFNSKGMHLRTLDAITGAVRYEFTYDSANRLVAVTDVDGNAAIINRDPLGNPTDIVGPFGQKTTLGLDTDGYLSSVSNPAGETVQLAYANEGLLSSLTDPKGQVHQFSYDSLGRLVNDTDPAGGSKSLIRDKFTNSYQVESKTAMDRITKYYVEDLTTGDQRLLNSYPDGTHESTLIGTNGSYKLTAADGTVADQQLGPDPRFGMQSPLAKTTSVTTPSGLQATVAEARTAALSSPPDPLSLTSLTNTVAVNGRNYSSVYSAATRKYTLTTPQGRQSTMTIDTKGRVIEEKEANLEPVSYTYDSHGRLATATVGTGTNSRTASFGYNVDGYLSSISDPLGQVTSYGYDTAGRVKSETFPDGGTVLFSYDGNGNLTTLTPPGRPSHSFLYNALDFLSAYTPPDLGAGSTTEYFYNPDRQSTQIVRPDGLAIDFGYDAGGRLSTVTHPDGVTGYAYDATTGNLTGINTSGGNALSYTYDGSVMKSETSSGVASGSVGYGFDNDFRVTSISVNGSNAVGYQYDGDSLLTKAGDLTLARNAQNGLISGTTLGGVSDSFTYNTFGERTSYTASFSGSEIFKQEFTYDALGRIVQKIEINSGASDTYDYTYNPAGSLQAVVKNNSTVSAYTYDGNGNRLSYTGPGGTVTGTYDNQDRLIRYGFADYSYTANGELQSKTVSRLTTQYSYDVFGNLKSVTLPNFTAIEYVMDGRNRRIGKKVNGVWRQKFLYMGQLKPVAELDGSDNVVSRFVYAYKINVPEYMVKGGITYRIISDHLGSPRLVVNPTDGSVAQKMDYDEFGKVMTDTNPGFQPFGFAGGLYDSDSGLIRFGARDYDPEIGRWTGRDPILFWGGASNLYSYVADDSVNVIDPTGLKPVENQFPPNDPAHDPFDKWEPPAGTFALPGHGDPKMGPLDSTKNPLSPERAARMVLNHPEYRHGMRVLPLFCFAGRGNWLERFSRALGTNQPITGARDLFNWKEADAFDEKGFVYKTVGSYTLDQPRTVPAPRRR